MSPRTERLFLLIICAAWLAYAAAFLWRSTVVVGGQRYFWLFDDAMISMRYAWNLAHGNGLTWNPGQPPVEGFTNPLWTLLMAAIHLLPHAVATISLYIQIVSAAALLATIVVSHRLGRALGAPAAVGLIAAATVAFFYPLNFFSLLGMETGVQALLYALVSLLLIRAHSRQAAPWVPWVLIAIAGLVRLDSYVFGLASLIAIWIISPSRLWRGHLLRAAVAILGSLALQTAVRLAYYHQPLPNTYYLKMTGYPMMGRILRGAFVTARSTTCLIWPLYLVLPLAYVWYTRHRAVAHRLLRQRLPRSAWLLLLIPVAAQFAYSAYVGGDVWEGELYANRFIVIIAPQLFLLTTGAIWLALDWLSCVGTFARKPSAGKNAHATGLLARYPTATTLILIPLLIIQTNHHTSYQWAWRQATLQVPPKDANFAADGIRLALALRSATSPDAVVVSERAGTIPYFLPRHPALDPLGKTDAHIAHQPSRELPRPITQAIRQFTPGHNKYDCSYTLTGLRPEIVALPEGVITGHCSRELDLEFARVNLPGSLYKIFVRKKGTKPKLDNAIARAYSSLGFNPN